VRFLEAEKIPRSRLVSAQQQSRSLLTAEQFIPSERVHTLAHEGRTFVAQIEGCWLRLLRLKCRCLTAAQ
jgi:hypothetical protein